MSERDPPAVGHATAEPECALADHQPSLFGLSELAHVDNPVQVYAHPLPGIGRMVLGPLPVGQPPGPLSRPRRLRILAVSESGSHFVAPTVMYEGRVDKLMSLIQWQVAQHPLVNRSDQDLPAVRRHLRTVQELTDPTNWHLWLNSPEVASPWVWQWATFATQSMAGRCTDEPHTVDPVSLVEDLGAVRLQRHVRWALEALSPSMTVLTRRPTLPQTLLLQLLEKLSARQPDESARRNVMQALSTLPLGQLRWIADSSGGGGRLFDMLCSGSSLPQAIRRECPAATPAAQRHATRCALIVPDTRPTTWRVALQALPLIGRHRWPATHSQWRCLLDIARRAETTADIVGMNHDPKVVLDAVGIAAQHLSLGKVPHAVRRGPHWAATCDGSGAPNVTSLASQLVAFRSSAARTLLMAGTARPAHTSDQPHPAMLLLDRLMSALAQSTDRAFVQEVVTMLADSPAARFGTLAVDLIRSPEDAAQAGARLDNCLKGTGRWRFAHYLLAGLLTAQIVDGDRMAALFTIRVTPGPDGQGIAAKADNPEGPANAAVPDSLRAAAQQYAYMLEEGGFGLDRYASITQAFRNAWRHSA